MVNISMGIEGRCGHLSTGEVEGVIDLDLGSPILSSFIYLFSLSSFLAFLSSFSFCLIFTFSSASP